MTRGKTIAVGVAIGLVGVPVLLVAVLVAAFYAIFYFPNRTTAVAGTIVSSGVSREYLLYVPPGYTAAKPSPLVISLHPAMSWPAAQMAFSRWNALADEKGFLVLYPAGAGSGPKVWFMHGRGDPSRMPDVVFIRDLIDRVSASYNVDRARIYADGFSNGGGMAFALSCTLSDRFAAVGMVAAARSLDFSWCTDPRPMPSIAFHGTADAVAPYAGGKTPVGPDVFPGVRAFTADWARRNHCDSVAAESAMADDVVRLGYSDCADGADVVLYTVTGGGHQWPGGRPLPQFLVGRYSASIDATRVMWDFFAGHPQPSRTSGAFAEVQKLNAELLASRSATLTLEAWCRDHHLADDPRIVAHKLGGAEKAATAEQRARLQVGDGEAIRYRHVELACGTRVLSDADNWYVPGRLTKEMNQLLDTTDTPFGKVVAPLEPTRETFDVQRFWTEPSQPSGPVLFEHRATLYAKKGHEPFAEVDERYQHVLAMNGAARP